MTEWMRCSWDEEDIRYLFEISDDGYVTRQIELRGPERAPIAAASLVEWLTARDTGRLPEYEAVYGLTAEPPVPEWEGHNPQPLSAADFEDAWQAARQAIHSRPG
ncbi:hypothetical protein [Peterkaempfera bronchialis]|uniref:hypothetical protein n=1 Tax=Peterkaempfera bronchialis TaxID=2126346 RepID=UPI003C2D7DA5